MAVNTAQFPWRWRPAITQIWFFRKMLNTMDGACEQLRFKENGNYTKNQTKKKSVEISGNTQEKNAWRIWDSQDSENERKNTLHDALV